jgi:hypothetical protein
VINNPQQQQQPQTSKWSMAHFLNAIDLVTCAMMTFRSYCLFYSAQKQTRRLDVSQKDKKNIGGTFIRMRNVLAAPHSRYSNLFTQWHLSMDSSLFPLFRCHFRMQLRHRNIES